ncbi:MAG: hypothetical protein ACI87E_000002 [Mariniblastus sp.]|jgi:hypothetical protein
MCNGQLISEYEKHEKRFSEVQDQTDQDILKKLSAEWKSEIGDYIGSPASDFLSPSRLGAGDRASNLRY